LAARGFPEKTVSHKRILFSDKETVKKKIRISLVHYLNSAPLGWAFLHGPCRDAFEVIPSSPARCADQLSKGEVDIGLIPSIEYPLIGNLRVVPDISIASLSEVRSILLVRPRGRETIETVALDSSSRTSIVLTKILLKEVLGICPRFVLHSPDLEAMLKKCDAALLIGDAALAVDLQYYNALDLAKMWTEWQKKPFVFAFWACRTDVPMPDGLAELFSRAKEWGLERRSEIAGVFSERLGLKKDFLENYLFHNINYDLGAEHIRGLRSYYTFAAQAGHIPRVEPLRFLAP
jgi:chorismate dehydratase